MNITRRIEPVVAAIGLVLVIGPVACSPRVRVDPIEVKPIHIVHDINIRVDRQLDEFFAFQESATQPATTTNATTQTVAGDVR